MFIKLAVFSWVASGYLSETTELCQPDGRPPPCEHVFQNICYEIWTESKSWTQARSSCAQRRGHLLGEFNDAIIMFLNDFTRQRSIGNLTWWLGQRVREDNLEALLGDYGTFLFFCQSNEICKRISTSIPPFIFSLNVQRQSLCVLFQKCYNAILCVFVIQ